MAGSGRSSAGGRRANSSIAQAQPVIDQDRYAALAAAMEEPRSNLWPCSASSCSRAERNSSTFACARAVAHQADAPDLAFISARPAPISMPNRFNSACEWRRHRCPGGTNTALSCGRMWPSCVAYLMPSAASPAQGLMIAQMPRVAVFEAFFVNQPQRFVQRVGHVDRAGVMINAVLAPIVRQHRDIEIPALHFRLACHESAPSPAG